MTLNEFLDLIKKINSVIDDFYQYTMVKFFCFQIKVNFPKDFLKTNSKFD